MKKAKLLLSLSLLCLSIAVLCFGVFSTISVTYSISGTISYEVTDVFAKINTKVFKVAGQTSSDNMQTNVDTLATTALSSISGTKTTSSSSLTYVDTNQSIDVYDTTSSNTASRNFDIDLDNEYMTYYIVINIENQASKTINAQLIDETVYTNLNTANILIQNGIAKGDTKNLVIAFSVSDKTVSISGVEMSYSVELGYEEYFESGVILTDDTAKQFYMNVGKYNGSPIRWNMVSADGITKYDSTNYETDKISSTFLDSVKGKAIFLQNTYIGDSCFDNKENDIYSVSVINTFVTTPNNFGLTSFPEYIASYTDENEDNGVVNGEKFWLLSYDQASVFCTSDEEQSFGDEGKCWWLRTPYKEGVNVGFSIYYMNDSIRMRFLSGLDDSYSVENKYAVRAAFQLA